VGAGLGALCLHLCCSAHALLARCLPLCLAAPITPALPATAAAGAGAVLVAALLLLHKTQVSAPARPCFRHPLTSFPPLLNTAGVVRVDQAATAPASRALHHLHAAASAFSAHTLLLFYNTAGVGRADQAAAAPAGRALHHLHAAAGGGKAAGLWGVQDHVGRAGAVRGVHHG